MSKPYWSSPGKSGASQFADDTGPGYPTREGYGGYDSATVDYDDYGGYGDYRGYGRTGSYETPTGDHGNHESFEDHADYQDARDARWRWVAGLAAIVLLATVVAIAVAVRGGDSATTSATTSQQPGGDDTLAPTTPRTVIATAPPAPTATLPPETIVTVTPSAQVPPAEAAPLPAPAQAAPPGQTITYTVTGTRQLFDLVSIIYTDEQGFPRTDVNVALPWTKTLVLNPGVETRSVTATSLTGQLNCTVTDGTGATIAAQSNNAAIATCTP
jgi:hypothetical protein